MQLILFSVIISLIIGGIAFFVLRFNSKSLRNDSEYLEYISKISTMYQTQEENGKLLYQMLEDPTDIIKTKFQENLLNTNYLLEEIEETSSSVNTNLRIRVVKYLLKRLKNHVEEMIWLRNYDSEVRTEIDTKSPYYEMYLESLDNITRINTYLQEILQISVEENQEFISKSKQNNQFLQILLISFVVLVLIASICFYILFADYVSRLIRNISSMTIRISEGSKHHEIVTMSGPKEIQELTVSFNNLLDTIYMLNEKAEEKAKLELRLSVEEKEKAKLELRLTEEELKKIKVQELLKESQLQGLQMQIKPHFLFNTLNIISMTALLENANKAHELILALSKFLRHSLKKASNTVFLNEEIDMISWYLYILKARMGEQLAYDIKYDVTTKNFKIPMFTLQPIIENAYKHGLENKLEQGIIQVNIKEKNTILSLRVYNNGTPMTKDELEIVRNKFLVRDVDFSQNKHIGIENVVYRLNITYGNKVKYYIRSSTKRGTLFNIQITIK
jgi:signal transduction histidine kinase